MTFRRRILWFGSIPNPWGTARTDAGTLDGSRNPIVPAAFAV